MNVQTNTETVNEIKQILEANPDEPKAVRLYLSGMACSGPAFGLTLDEPTDQDEIFTFEGQDFIMQKEVFEQFGDMIVEFVNGAYRVEPVSPVGGGCSSCSCCG